VKGPLVPLIWAALLAVHTIVLLALGGDVLEALLLAGAAAGSAVLAALMALRRDREGPDLSGPTALAAIAVAGLVIGAELGPWLLLISAGALLLAFAGLAREGLR
jgi:hypothetical protein